MSVFIPIPKKSNAKECLKCHTIAHIPCAIKVVLKILEARLQKYFKRELPDIQAGFRKGRGTRGQTANMKSCFLDYAKAFDCVDHKKTGKFLKRWEHQTT